MKRINKIIIILEEAEKLFRLRPSKENHTDWSLCNFIWEHRFSGITDKTKVSYQEQILIGINRKHFVLGGAMVQDASWEHPAWKYDRANWCLNRIKELKG